MSEHDFPSLISEDSSGSESQRSDSGSSVGNQDLLLEALSEIPSVNLEAFKNLSEADRQEDQFLLDAFAQVE